MKYVVIAILLYLLFMIFRMILKNISARHKNSGKINEHEKSRTYDVNKIQDAEYREVNKDDNP